MNVIDLGLGAIQLPDGLSIAAGQSVRWGQYDRTGRAGAACSMIGGWLETQYGQRFAPEQICVTAGASGALCAAVMALTKPGDVVLLPTPGYPGYRGLVQALHRVPEYYSVTWDARQAPEVTVTDAQLQRATMLFWNFPHNPTGLIPSAEQVERLLSRIAAHNVVCVSDDVYADPALDCPLPLHYGTSLHLVTIGSVSKTLGLCGLRLGWAVADPTVLQAIAAAHWSMTMGASPAGADLLAQATANWSARQRAIRVLVAENRCRAVAQCRQAALSVPLETATVPFLLIDIRASGLDAQRFARIAQQRENLVVTPGSVCGDALSHVIRINLGVEWSLLHAGLARLAAVHELARSVTTAQKMAAA